MTTTWGGIQQKGKRLIFFSYSRDKLKNNGVIFFQETHSTPALEDSWTSEWGGKLYFSHGESNARGVAIGFSKDFDCNVDKIHRDCNGRVLILEISKDGDDFVLINFYNANSESDQILALRSLNDLLTNIDQDKERKNILMGDFNLIFNVHLDALGGNPTLKKKSLASVFKLLSNLDVSDIFRLRFPNQKRYTFRQKIGQNIIHRRLDYIFLSNSIHE